MGPINTKFEKRCAAASYIPTHAVIGASKIYFIFIFVTAARFGLPISASLKRIPRVVFVSAIWASVVLHCELKSVVKPLIDVGVAVRTAPHHSVASIL